jgi:hypothetical protein
VKACEASRSREMTYMPCLKLQLDDDLKQALVGDEVATFLPFRTVNTLLTLFAHGSSVLLDTVCVREKPLPLRPGGSFYLPE